MPDEGKANTSKFAFCSREWVAVADEFVKESAKDTDLTGINYTFNEVFTDAPEDLSPDSEGRVGWYIRVADGKVEAGSGILDNPDVCIQADYAEILPLARGIFTNDPEAAAAAQATIAAMSEAGRFTSTTTSDAPADLPWSAGLHDTLARRTL